MEGAYEAGLDLGAEAGPGAGRPPGKVKPRLQPPPEIYELCQYIVKSCVKQLTPEVWDISIIQM